MATHIYNSDLSTEIREGARVQASMDTIPSELAEKVIAVMETNPKILKSYTVIASAAETNPAAAATLYTTPTNQDFYLCDVSLELIKNATSDLSTGIFCSLTAVVGGVTRTLMAIPGITLTAQTASKTMTFAHPIKIDRGSAILVVGQSAPSVGTYIRYCSITGFNMSSSNG